MEYLFREHLKKQIKGPPDGKDLSDILFLSKNEAKCARFFLESGNHHVEFSYYIGADWIPHLENEWLYVESKLNTKFNEQSGADIDPSAENDLVQIDVLKMLFQALKEPEVRNHTQALFEIKFDSPWIPLKKSQDLISPLIMIQFLNLVKGIVKKGLKKSYYKVQENLYSRVKGKVLVSQTIKQNQAKNKNLHTYCQYEVFGVDGMENRILKKTLVFIRRYMSTIKGLGTASFFQETFNYLQPAFQEVSEEVNLNDIKHIKFNSFYKDYEKALELAKMILRRYSYNLNNILDQETILTPPYWIDMSKLFELYILEKLKKSAFGKKIEYHPTTYGNELDYLLVAGDNSIVIDAKYKPSYKFHVNHEDIRQVSGYSRLRKIRVKAGVTSEKMLDCVIIYPDLESNTYEINSLTVDDNEISQYEKVWKIGISLPRK